MYEGVHDTRKGLEGDDRLAVGFMTAKLLLPWNTWVHRRVERIEFCDVDAMRRKTSIDFTLPYWFHEMRIAAHTRKAQSESPARWGAYRPRRRANPDYSPGNPRDRSLRQLVPLGFLRKGVLVNFSLWNESSMSLPLLTTEQNAQVAEAALYVIAAFALRSDVPPAIVCDIGRLVRERDERNAKDIYRRIFERKDSAVTQGARLRHDQVFSTTAYTFVRNMLALTMLDIYPHQRRIVHWAYEESIWDNGDPGRLTRLGQHAQMAVGVPRRLGFAIPGAANTDSYHVEVEAPDDLQVDAREEYRPEVPEDRRISPIRAGGYKRAHLHFPNAARSDEVSIAVRLLPRSETIIRSAFFASILTLAALVMVAAQLKTIRAPSTLELRSLWPFMLRGGSDQAATAATLLLATIGFGGLFFVRQSASAMSTSLLLPVRLLAISPVVFSFIGAVAVVGHLPVSDTQAVMFGACALNVVSIFGLAVLWWQTSRAARGRPRK